MVRDEVKLLDTEGKSAEEIRKIDILCDFMGRLPTDAMRAELIELIEKQPSMAPGQFEDSLHDFSQRVHATLFKDSVSPYALNARPSRLH